MNFRIIFFLFISIIFSAATFSHLKIEITEGSQNPIRIAIVPIGWNLDNPSRGYLHQMVSSDLESF
ncbi:uncharacterized protein METZ01_LOCUS244772, partial [marine metagenome]